jgi:hypothetical protein
MKPSIALAALAIALASPLAAQLPAPAPVDQGVTTLVRLTGIVNPIPSGDPPLPFPILARIETDPHLAYLDTEARTQTGPALVLTFAFPSVEAYRAWYETAETRQLLDELRRRVSQLELTVSLRRGPHGPIPAAQD